MSKQYKCPACKQKLNKDYLPIITKLMGKKEYDSWVAQGMPDQNLYGIMCRWCYTEMFWARILFLKKWYALVSFIRVEPAKKRDTHKMHTSKKV